MIELLRELGLNAASRVGVSGVVEALEENQEKIASKLSINRPETLAKLRASYQNFTRTEREDLRRAALLQMHRQLRLLAGGASALAFQKIAQMSTALEALLIELYTEPVKITPSVVRTVAHSIETLASLVDHAANSQGQEITSPKILVVDDEVISRETISSALSRAGLYAERLDDPLAALVPDPARPVGRRVERNLDLDPALGAQDVDPLVGLELGRAGE
jgi:chemotaxis protein histidine kinase CheA